VGSGGRILTTCKVTAPNNGTTGAAAAAGSGLLVASTSNEILSRATRIVQIYLPGQLFTKSQKLIYGNGSSGIQYCSKEGPPFEVGGDLADQ
jgi:hypothetical protein